VADLPREGGADAAFLGAHYHFLFMIPIPPLSVKFGDDERARLKALANTLGWSESQVVRDSVTHVLHLIQHPDTKDQPKLITLARLARCNEENPTLLQKHIKKVHFEQPPLTTNGRR
jgi:hypothetical protein